MKLWIRVAAALALVWLLATGAAWMVDSIKPTPESLTRYVETHPIANVSSEERARVIDKVASQLNRLSFEERRSVRMSQSLDGFFRSLTNAERNDFLDKTMPEGFKQMMLALNKMTPEKRKEIVDRTMNDLQKADANDHDRRQPVDDAQRQKIVSQGMSAFYENANADVKMDFAPVIEQMQRSMQLSPR